MSAAADKKRKKPAASTVTAPSGGNNANTSKAMEKENNIKSNTAAAAARGNGSGGAAAAAATAAATELKSYCSPNVQSVVFPGDVIALKPQTKIRVGPGLMQHKESVLAAKCGVLRQVGTNKLWVDNMQKRYIPMVEDMVVGVVIEKHVESYRVDINSTQPARLPALAFEGASKRNKPNIPVGSLVYCRVVMANKDMEAELSCTSPHLKKDWVTGETLFGELTAGYVFKTSLSLARTLLDEDCTVLKCLGAHIPFELAIGANGQVWIKSGSPLHTVVISNAILNSEHTSAADTQMAVERLVKSIL